MLEENNNLNPQPQGQEYWAPPQQIPVAPVNPYSVIPEEYREKRDIRRLARTVGIPTLCLSAIGYIWYYVYAFFTMRIFGMTDTQATELLQNPAVQQILQIVLSCTMFLLPFSIAAKCAGVRIDNTIQFGLAKKGTFLPFVLFGVGFCAFSNVATSYVSAFFETFTESEYNVPQNDNPEGIFGFLLTFIATAIVPALVEEFACRGIVLGLLKKYGQGFAIVTSSIIFGVMHGNFDQIPFATMVGLVLGYIYVKTESIWPCVAVHSINNAISVIFSYLPSTISATVQNVIYLGYLTIALLGAIIGVLLFSKKTDEKYALERKDCAITEKQKYTRFFTSWAIILFLAINLYEAISYFSFWGNLNG